VQLGLVAYDNDPANRGEYPRLAFKLPLTPEEKLDRPSVHAIRLSQFGRLFHKACVRIA
jgi:hypothetical protein